MSAPVIAVAGAEDAGGAGVVLLPGRAAWLPTTATLLVADLHLGKAAAFRRAGIPVPEGSAAADLDRLGRLVAEQSARRLLVLGDLFHSVGGMTDAVEEQFRRWRRGLGAVEVVLVVGNHDARLGRRLGGLGLDQVAAALDEPPLHLIHDPRGAVAERFVVGGHLHPAVTLRGPTWERIRERCFVADAARLVLPAFGSFTGAMTYEAVPGERVWIGRDDAVVDVSRLVQHSGTVTSRSVRRAPRESP